MNHGERQSDSNSNNDANNHGENMIAILTKYLGPTNTRGSRIKAFCGHDRRIACTISYRHDLNPEDAHKAAIFALIEKCKWRKSSSEIIGPGEIEFIGPGEIDHGHVYLLKF